VGAAIQGTHDAVLAMQKVKEPTGLSKSFIESLKESGYTDKSYEFGIEYHKDGTVRKWERRETIKHPPVKK
jgi:hypothetical protein